MNRLIEETPSPKAEAMVAAYAGLQARTSQAELLDQWDPLRAALTDDAAQTPAGLTRITSRLLPDVAVDAVTATTRARLRELGVVDDMTQGKAALLALLFGPRFFEDPFKPWAELGAEAAVAAAWRVVAQQV